MAKSRKQAAPWQGFLMGGAACVGVYLLGLLLLSLLLVKGVLSEENRFPAVAALCVLAALCGGSVSIWRSARRAGGMAAGAVFAAVLVMVGMVFWRDGIAWLGHGGILLLCALAGGLLAGAACGKRSRGGRRKRK